MTVLTQDHWAWCSKCEGIFYGPHAARSSCPKGGPHIIGSGSYNYQVSYNGTYPVPVPPPPAPGTRHPVPARVAGCYWTTWNPLALGSVNAAYNLIWLFAAKCDSVGTASWPGASSETAALFKADLQARRAKGTCCILTVGGSGASVPLTNRANSTNFVTSIKAIDASLGGIDGIDFDIENAADINAAELVWTAQQLKAALPGFQVTWAGADPNWITNGTAAAKAMADAGVLDLTAVMCYDWSQGTEAGKISMSQSYVNSWAAAVGAGRTCIGVELPNPDDSPQNTFGSYTSVLSLWNWALTAHPGIRGMDIWTAYEDARGSGGSNGTFVSGVIPAVLA